MQFTWIQQASAKLVKIFEKAIKRCHKIQYFYRYSIDFILNMQYLFIRKCVKISLFWNILPYQFAYILNAPFLPRTIRISKINNIPNARLFFSTVAKFMPIFRQ